MINNIYIPFLIHFGSMQEASWFDYLIKAIPTIQANVFAKLKYDAILEVGYKILDYMVSGARDMDGESYN